MSRIARDADDYNKKRNQRAVDKTMGTFKVATASPLTVYLDGSTVAVAALKIAGQSLAVDDTGIYWLRQGQLPVCAETSA
jgi:hypothetical protein